MKIAVFSESPADEAALRVLLDAIRGERTTPVGVHARLAARGWTMVRDLLPSTIRHLYYRTDADGLVVLVDSDDSPLHEAGHDLPGGVDPRCRLCTLKEVAGRTLDTLQGHVAGRTLRVAVGLAVPAVEAWWLCGIDQHATEQAWARGLGSSRRRNERAQLKRAVYGTDRPSLVSATEKMVAAAERLGRDLTPLERHFPIGFGQMAHTVRGWTS